MSGSSFWVKRIAMAVIGFGVAICANAETNPSPETLALQGAVQLRYKSEAEMLSLKAGKGAVRLRDGASAWKTIYDRMHELGQIRSVTRNAGAVIERTGRVTKARLDKEGRVVPPTGFLGGAIDLRFSMDKWRSGFALEQPTGNGKILRSLQFFDQTGTAVNQIFLENEQGLPAFRKLVADFKAPRQHAAIKQEAMPPKAGSKDLTTADMKELQLSWSELTDVHEFARLVKDFGITRERAFELIGNAAAYRVLPGAIQMLFDAAAQQGQEVLAFVSNPGMIQIYGGKIEQTVVADNWYHAQAQDFRLALLRDRIDRGWVVKRPAKDGVITSVEFYDANGDQIINIFSRRQRGKEESEVWRKIVASLARMQ